MVKFKEKDKEFLLKLKEYRSKIWGIDFFFSFWSQCSKKEQFQKFHSKEFQDFLEQEFADFMVLKTKVFKQISDVCCETYCDQVGSRQKSQLKKLSDGIASDLLFILWNNVVSENLILKDKSIETFNSRFGSNSKIPRPLKFFDNLEEKKILIQNSNFFSFENVSIFNFNYLTSNQLMSINQQNQDQEIFKIKIETLYLMLDEIESGSKFIELIPRSLENLSEYDKFIDLVKDFSDPEQYFKFKDPRINKCYSIINKYKLIEIDKFFQSLLVYFLDGVYFSAEEKKNNSLYRQILKEKNER